MDNRLTDQVRRISSDTAAVHAPALICYSSRHAPQFSLGCAIPVAAQLLDKGLLAPAILEVVRVLFPGAVTFNKALAIIR